MSALSFDLITMSHLPLGTLQSLFAVDQFGDLSGQTFVSGPLVRLSSLLFHNLLHFSQR